MTWTVGRIPRGGVFTPSGNALPATPTGAKVPAGAVLHRELTRASHWDVEVEGFLTEPGGVGPGGEPIVRSTLLDDQNSNPGANDAERTDLRAGDVPLGSTRCMDFYMRTNALPSNYASQGGFLMIGPHEIHGNTLPQATVQPQIGGSGWYPQWAGQHIFEANAGLAQHDFYPVGAIDLGNWHRWTFIIKYANDNTGYAELYRDDVLVFSKYGYATTGEAQGGYWKLAHYRNPEMTGTSQYDLSGCRIYRVGAL